jgi:hypothetical protein
MNERQQYVLNICEAVTSSLKNSDEKSFSTGMKLKLVGQINKMIEALDPEIFSPTYARAVIDSYSGALADQLIEVEYEYSRIRKNGRLRGGCPSAYQAVQVGQ